MNNATRDVKNPMSRLLGKDYDNKWIYRYLDMCDFVSSWSKDPRTKVGCVITDNLNKPLSFGYNGFARGLGEPDYIWNSRHEKYQYAIHAEENAILNSNCNLKDSIVYCNLMPCTLCASKLVQIGASKVYTWTPSGYDFNNRCIDKAYKILDECGVELHFVNKCGE